LTTTLKPGNALFNKVKWDVYDNTIGAGVVKYNTSCKITGSAACDGNGTIRVRASAIGKPDVYDEIEVAISGQGGEECLELAHDQKSNLTIFPNPAEDRLSIILPQSSDFKVEIFTASGQKVLEDRGFNGSLNLSLDRYQKGIYFIKTTDDRFIYNRKLLLQ